MDLIEILTISRYEIYRVITFLQTTKAKVVINRST